MRTGAEVAAFGGRMLALDDMAPMIEPEGGGMCHGEHRRHTVMVKNTAQSMS